MREFLKHIASDKIKSKYRRLRACCIRLIMSCMHIFPIDEKKVVLTNVWGYADNPKYVTEELLRRKSGLKLYYVAERNGLRYVPKGVTPLRNNSISALFALATAKVWVECNHKEEYIKKRKKQYYIQCWHGSIALKKIEWDCSDALDVGYLANVTRDAAMTDLYISNGAFATAMYRRAFKYKGEILECGSPRMDILINPDSRRIIRTKKRLGIDEKTRLVVYAPTYRELERKHTEGHIFPDYDKLLESIETGYGGEFVIIQRLHPLVAKNFGKNNHSKVIDGNKYPDLYELLEAADLLITDYSNTMFEFAYAGKPVYLYAPDIATYEWDRGFYLDYNKLPFAKAFDDQELTKMIRDREDLKLIEPIRSYLKKLDMNEPGTASSQIVDRIYKSGISRV